MAQKIYIIGGGPAGMNAAIAAKEFHPNDDVILLDSQDRLGKKLQQTGGGRCNVTANLPVNALIESIPKNGKFLYSSFSTYGSEEIIQFFTENNCPLKEEDHHRMFPLSNKSTDIIETLTNKMLDLGVIIYYECEVIDITPENKEIHTANQTFIYDYLIIATGGKTLPQTGSNGVGYMLAEKLGHTISPLIPAEVPLVSNDTIIQDKTLQGLSFQDVELTVYKKNKRFKKITHDLLFTHFGLSGPAALRSSFYILPLLEKNNGEPVTITIDFLPQVHIQLLEDTLRKQDDIQPYLMKLGLPKRLIQTLLELSDENIKKLTQLLKKFPISIYDTRGFRQAFVTNGGIKVKEVDPQTMKSKLDTSVSFCGEVLDINAYTGGFNITAALSTGYNAGKNVY